MKRWALVTVGLYILCLAVLAVPFCLIGDESELIPYFYIWVAPVLIVVQAALLLIPVAQVQGRPVGRRRVATAAILGALPTGALGLAVYICATNIAFGEDGSEPYLWPPFVLFIPVAFWLFWGILFYLYYSPERPDRFLTMVTRTLLGGSIMELLVAIPAHIIARRRGECCAPFITYFGIITGIAIGLLAFGPGVFFLLAKRVKAKQNAAAGLGAAVDAGIVEDLPQ